MFIGNSGEDAVELTCTVTVMVDIIEALYQFTWKKDGNLIDLSNSRLQVRTPYNMNGMVAGDQGCRRIYS